METWKRFSVRTLIALLMMHFLPTLAQAAEFSATVVTKMGAEEQQGKIFIKGDKIRSEMAGDQGGMISILRQDQKKIWMIMPEQKSYMEMPLNPEAARQFMTKEAEGPDEKVEMKRLGTETVNGYETEKYEATIKMGGQAMKQYVWIATKLKMPIKMVMADGSHAVEYRDIQVGSVEDALFEPPKDYQKVQLPGMGGMPPRPRKK